VKDGGAEAVKLEGGIHMARTIEAIAAIDVPVMGHVGLTPQSVHRMGGHRVQGRRSGRAAGERDRVLDDARAVQAAGAFAVVLECIPLDLAAEITAELTIPTIGIGAGVHCDGQVLVLHDLIGLSDAWTPRFAKRYAEVGREVVRDASASVEEVKGGAFPSEAQAFKPGAKAVG
jgi:3-methyl-2-oxobutanoate hydroxymethyltransferase